MTKARHTYQIQVKGLVQGVGFRPFIYRLAQRFGILGTVDNRADGVLIIAKCAPHILNEFINAIQNESPKAAEVNEVTFQKENAQSFTDFKIVKSKDNPNSKEVTEVSPDIGVCDECLQDIKTQAHRIDYPLTNCTHCGPRFTIIKALPYDRDLTTMKPFPMCEQCRKEYTSVLNRRFHAQPVACNHCGPHYSLRENGGELLGTKNIIKRLSELIAKGNVVALKGMGGFHLLCDAHNETAVSKLREIKNRDAKPFAVMFKNVITTKEYASMDEVEEAALCSWQKPIVLLKQKKALSEKIGNGFTKVGAILPYMPFHYLMFEQLKTDAVVLTSGNRSDEPIIIDEQEIEGEFQQNIAAVISYNRAIYNRVDDSVMQKVGVGMQLIRRSRSFAPQSIPTTYAVDNLIATGAELLNTFTVGRANKAIISQHIGDLKNAETLAFFEEGLARYKDLFRVNPTHIICDKHPDYLSSQFARSSELPIMEVQHHHAHIASCMCEHLLDEQVIGIVFDGTGLGDDGNIWGAEFMLADLEKYERIAHFDYIALPGGDQVTKQPWRTALSVLYQVYGADLWDLDIPFIKRLDVAKANFICQMIDKKINSPLSSGMGRLFDAVSALCGLTLNSAFHAEAPMRLEDAIQQGEKGFYPYAISESIGIGSIIKALITDLKNGVAVGIIAARFHNTLVKISVEQCVQIREKYNTNKVVLSGGSFQNKYLSEHLIKELKHKNFKVYNHQNIPSNDGGISLGQIAIASKILSKDPERVI